MFHCCWTFAGIRDHVVQSVELKFNCFFLMPVVDSFPTRLREELESAYDDDIDEVFDVTAVRNALESRLKALESELHQVIHHFGMIAEAMLYAHMILRDEAACLRFQAAVSITGRYV